MQQNRQNRTKLKGRLSPTSFIPGKTAIGLHSKSERQRAKRSLPFHQLSFLGTRNKTNCTVSILFLRGINCPFEPLWSAQEWDVQYILGRFGRQCRCGLIQITWVCVFLKGQVKDLVLGEVDRIRFPERKRPVCPASHRDECKPNQTSPDGPGKRRVYQHARHQSKLFNICIQLIRCLHHFENFYK